MTVKKSLKNVLFFYSIIFGVAYVPLISFLSFQSQSKALLSLMQFFTSDTFYYLSIARHSVEAGFYTADGVYPTNGFHPLWGFILTKLFEIQEIYNNYVSQMYLVFGLSLILVIGGMVFFAFTLYKITNSYSISLLASVPGFYYLLLSPVAPNYNSTWSFINGMESPSSIFLFGIFSFLLLHKRILLNLKISSSIFLTIVITLIVFSRLDDVFFLIPYFMLIVFFSNSKKQVLINSIISVGIPSIAILVYMIYNHSYTGNFLPVSGLIKQGNWLIVNLFFFLNTFIPVGLINPNADWSETSMRTLQMFIPVLFSMAWLFYHIKPIQRLPANKELKQSKFIKYQLNPAIYLWCKKIPGWFLNLEEPSKEAWGKEHYEKIILVAFAFYVILKGLYNIIYVYLMGQGHWYYPISIMIFNMLLAILITDSLKKYSVPQKGVVINISSILIIIVVANSFINNKILSNYNTTYYDFWVNSPDINKEILSIDENIKIVEYDDGIISYFTAVPVMNGFGFTLDQEAFEAQYNGYLLAVAYKRGYDVIGVMSYINFPQNIENNSDTIRQALRTMPGIKLENLDLWEFEFLYKNPNSSAVFIRFKPVQ